MQVFRIVKKRIRSYKSVQNRLNPNLHSRNTLFQLKKVFKKDIMEMKVWVQLGIIWRCARSLYTQLLFQRAIYDASMFYLVLAFFGAFEMTEESKTVIDVASNELLMVLNFYLVYCVHCIYFLHYVWFHEYSLKHKNSLQIIHYL